MAFKLKPLGKTAAPKPKTHKPIYNPSLGLQQTTEGKSYLACIRKLEPFERLVYWITERHAIHHRRFPDGMAFSGDPRIDLYDRVTNAGSVDPEPPWTQDPILQTIFFCNPYRENDKVTAYLRDNFREECKGKEHVFLGTILLRMFNYIPTMQKLLKAGIPYRMVAGRTGTKALAEAARLLVPLRNRGVQMFGGAYIIKFFNGMRKVEAGLQIMQSLVDCKALTDSKQQSLYDLVLGAAHQPDQMQLTHDLLTSFDGMGPFYCYQFIGDLAYTHVLAKAKDWWTWGFCGPGTSRGLLRLRGISTKADGTVFERRIDKPRGWQDQLLELQEKLNKELAGCYFDKNPANRRSAKLPDFPRMHMRDLCNCLCEYDKYERALNHERSVKRPYAGT